MEANLQNNLTAEMDPCSQAQRIADNEKMTLELRADVAKIKDALLPSEFHPNNGLINQVANLKDDVKEVKETLMKAKMWLYAAAAIIGGIVGTVQIVISIVK
jgi:hypothetical protein